MNIARMYTIALGSFGYTENEARFLYFVAAHSGYFTCQQFLRFVDGKPGKRSLSFVRKLYFARLATIAPGTSETSAAQFLCRLRYASITESRSEYRITAMHF